MTHLYLGVLAGNALASLVALQLGGTLGAGAVLGFALGSLLGVAGTAGQRRVLVTRPRGALTVFVGFFLAKLVLLAAGGLCLRFSPPLAARFDWAGYLVAFAAAVVWVTALSTVRELFHLRQERTW